MENKELILCKHTDFNRNTHILSLQQNSACTLVTWVSNLLLVVMRFPDNSDSSGTNINIQNIDAHFYTLTVWLPKKQTTKFSSAIFQNMLSSN